MSEEQVMADVLKADAENKREQGGYRAAADLEEKAAEWQARADRNNPNQ
jgi:hypothetical protein